MSGERTVALPCPGCEARVPCVLVSRVDAAAEPELAAWTVVSRAVLNLDETITKE